MRKILFKGQRKDNGEWVEGYYRADNDLDCHFICGWSYDYSEDGIEREPFEEEIFPSSLCQYTGLKDKNGQKIWENDILHVVEKMGNDVYRNGNLISLPRWVNKSNFKVEFNPGGLMNTQRFVNSPQIEYEVIGNIFDNSDLLWVEE